MFKSCFAIVKIEKETNSIFLVPVKRQEQTLEDQSDYFKTIAILEYNRSKKIMRMPLDQPKNLQ